MPKDPRSISERKNEQIMAKEIMKAASKQTRCAHCNEEIGYYSLAGIAIRVDDLTWCDTVCHDDWMDAADAAQKAIDEKISELGASVARAAAEILDKEVMQSFDTEDREAIGEKIQDWHELADFEMIYWCDKLNAISGIETCQSCSGHKKGDTSKAEGIWGYETNANLWFVCDWITDDIALSLAKVPAMERIRKIYHSDGEKIWDLSFAGNNKDKLDESMQAILETLRRAQK